MRTIPPARAANATAGRLRPSGRALRLAALLAQIAAASGCGGSSAPANPNPPGPTPVPDQWVRLASGPLLRQEVAVAAIGNSIYVIGGFTAAIQPSTDVQVYNAATDTWTTTTPLPVPLHHPGAAVGGKVYVFGGFPDLTGQATDQTFIFDPATNAWAAGPLMLERKGAVAVAVQGQRIFVAGGVNNGARVASLHEFNPATLAWTVHPSMTTPRDHLVAGVAGGGVIVVGGRNNTGNELRVAEFFNLTTLTWSQLPPMTTGRSGSAAAVFGTRFYVFGGEVNAAAPSGVFPQTEYFDTADNQWHTALPMLVPKHGTGAAVIGNRIILPQGAIAAGIGPTNSCEAYVIGQ